jgi:hypothetical protein
MKNYTNQFRKNADEIIEAGASDEEGSEESGSSSGSGGETKVISAISEGITLFTSIRTDSSIYFL